MDGLLKFDIFFLQCKFKGLVVSTSITFTEEHISEHIANCKNE